MNFTAFLCSMGAKASYYGQAARGGESGRLLPYGTLRLDIAGLYRYRSDELKSSDRRVFVSEV